MIKLQNQIFCICLGTVYAVGHHSRFVLSENWQITGVRLFRRQGLDQHPGDFQARRERYPVFRSLTSASRFLALDGAATEQKHLTCTRPSITALVDEMRSCTTLADVTLELRRKL